MEHSNTDAVPESGEYRCTSCSMLQEFEQGDDFTMCDGCGDENSMWERVGVPVEEDLEDDGLGF